jgi:3-hydroxyacyl-CoA dehydrogenase/enoyl-CoA hydratase/3-hydroxybutyryl-CoA epimerase
MIRIDLDDGVAIATWDMPGRAQNVFNQESLDAWSTALDRLAQEEVTGVVITSGKRDLAAGADLDAIRTMIAGGRSAEELTEGSGALSRVLRRLETLGKPVCAAIPGTALGGGLELALACHHRIVADDPRIQLGLPEAQLGLLPGAGGTQRLPRMIGVMAALPLLMEGKQLRPAAALKAGIVDEVLAADAVLPAAIAWVRAHPTAKAPWDDKRFAVPGGGPSDAKVAQTFMVANAMFMAKTSGRYPAGAAILSCVYEGLRTTLDAGLLIEQRYFVSLLLDPTAGAMIRTLFLNLQDANKLVRRPPGVERRPPQRLGVLGAGLMGSGIALVAARRGIDVVVLDAERAAGAVQYAAARLDRDVAKGRSTPQKRDAVLARITPTGAAADLAGCDLVIEAVFEDREVKAAVTRAAEAVLGADAVIASNTSTLPITGLAAACDDPTRFVGLHFFSPVERMQLVEVIVGEQTSDRTLAWALDTVVALGKTPIVVNDRRGFYTSRVFGTYITEGMVMLTDGVSPTLVEAAGRASGMPMPPLALADEVGLALMYQVGVQTRKDLGDAAPDNPSQAVLEELVARRDRVGKRGGQGFYDHGEHKALWPELTELFPSSADQPDVEALVERFLIVQALEAVRCVDEGVVRAIEDVDVGAVLGWGFAPWTGGPLSYVDRIGAAAFVAKARALAATHGPRFEPPPLLVKMAEEGGSFYP